MNRLCNGLFFFIFSVSLSATAETNLSQLEEREGVRYLKGAEQPFSGTAVDYFKNGQQRMAVSFREGLKQGKETAWYEDGQLQYVVRYRKGKPQGYGSSWYRQQQGEKLVQGILHCENSQKFEITCVEKNSENGGAATGSKPYCGDYNALASVCGELTGDMQVEKQSEMVFCDGRDDLADICGPQEETESPQNTAFLFCDGRSDMAEICGESEPEEEPASGESLKFLFCDASPETKAFCGR